MLFFPTVVGTFSVLQKNRVVIIWPKHECTDPGQTEPVQQQMPAKCHQLTFDRMAAEMPTRI